MEQAQGILLSEKSMLYCMRGTNKWIKKGKIYVHFFRYKISVLFSSMVRGCLGRHWRNWWVFARGRAPGGWTEHVGSALGLQSTHVCTFNTELHDCDGSDCLHLQTKQTTKPACCKTAHSSQSEADISAPSLWVRDQILLTSHPRPGIQQALRNKLVK